MGWSKSLTGFARQVGRDLTDMQKEVSLYAFQQLILLSPVDSGAYRGNHRLTVGFTDDGYNLEATGDYNQQQAQRRLAALNVPFTVVHIQNNLPYGEEIENGHSQQAPGGVYELATNNTRERYGG